MKSEKGIAMVSLVIYITSFLIITTLVGTISTYFYNNMNLLNINVGGNSEYNKLNLYLTKNIKDENLKDLKVASADLDGDSYIENAIVFYTDSGKNLLLHKGNYIYYNNSILCSSVEKFEFSFDEDLEANEGKKVLNVSVKIAGSSFVTRYVIG